MHLIEFPDGSRLFIGSINIQGLLFQYINPIGHDGDFNGGHIRSGNGPLLYIQIARLIPEEIPVVPGEQILVDDCEIPKPGNLNLSLKGAVMIKYVDAL
jgi:hypothetical protein